MSHGRLSLVPFPKDHGTSNSGETTQLIQAAHSYATLAVQARFFLLTTLHRVQEAQNAKARAQVAFNRARKKKKLAKEQSHEEQSPSAVIESTPSVGDYLDDPFNQDVAAIESPPSDNSYGQFNHDDSVLSMDNDVLQWQKDWGSESTTWNDVFDTELACSRTKGERAINIFLDEVAQRAMDGRSLLESIQEVVHTHRPYCRERLKYDAILLYDLLVAVISEVKFFEVKLDTVRMDSEPVSLDAWHGE
ncbi:hypothetical protein F4604DRAFT_1681460 [Suillus subluteus]|nr:hypothetical protein F4604DRAFT_1681460 [Suillus subluteus]